MAAINTGTVTLHLKNPISFSKSYYLPSKTLPLSHPTKKNKRVGFGWKYKEREREKKRARERERGQSPKVKNQRLKEDTTTHQRVISHQNQNAKTPTKKYKSSTGMVSLLLFLSICEDLNY